MQRVLFSERGRVRRDYVTPRAARRNRRTPILHGRASSQRIKSSKSFLVLFFKKELLPSYSFRPIRGSVPARMRRMFAVWRYQTRAAMTAGAIHQ
jgi:hypothetical protein